MAQKQRQEHSALWVSYLLSGVTGSVVTPEQLLGTEEEVLASKEAAANAKIAEFEERMKKAGLANG